MLLIDKIRNGDLVLPATPKDVNEARVSAVRAGMMDLLRVVPVVEASNILEFCQNQQVVNLAELPCLAPPRGELFVEFSDGYDSFGVLGTATKPEGRRWESELLPDDETWDRRVGWVWDLLTFGNIGNHVYGPVSAARAALDHDGRWLEQQVVLLGSALRDAGEDEKLQRLMDFAVGVFFQTIDFMLCANIRTVYVDAPAALSRKHRRKGHITGDLVRYQRLMLEPEGPDVRARGKTGESGAPRPFHAVRGTFHHYGNCCPGVHEPKGLLFGRREGRFWVPEHGRGTPDAGAIVSDYVMKPVRKAAQ